MDSNFSSCLSILPNLLSFASSTFSWVSSILYFQTALARSLHGYVYAAGGSAGSDLVLSSGKAGPKPGGGGLTFPGEQGSETGELGSIQEFPWGGTGNDVGYGMGCGAWSVMTSGINL